MHNASSFSEIAEFEACAYADRGRLPNPLSAHAHASVIIFCIFRKNTEIYKEHMFTYARGRDIMLTVKGLDCKQLLVLMNRRSYHGGEFG